MRVPSASLFAFLISLVASCAIHGEAEKIHEVDSSGPTLLGQVILPNGFARRGMEVHATVIASNGEPLDTWVSFNDKGHFSHTYKGRLASLTVTAGVSAEVFRLEGGDLPSINQAGQIDIGKVDLRDRLLDHRLVIRAAEGKAPGEVRVAMWFDPPPVGPGGGRVSLGSKQFPSVTLGNEMQWLVPLEAESIYFLVERPAESGQGSGWRSGHQRLFGPFISADLPRELFMD